MEFSNIVGYLWCRVTLDVVILSDTNGCMHGKAVYKPASGIMPIDADFIITQHNKTSLHNSILNDTVVGCEVCRTIPYTTPFGTTMALIGVAYSLFPYVTAPLRASLGFKLGHVGSLKMFR